MSGLGLILANHLSRKPTRKCERCGLQFSASEDSCPHCKDLDEYGLGKLVERIQGESQANRNLGILFFSIASILAFILIGLFTS
jgi:hypothetical protein